jgi:lysine-arginine-ornithine-binding protein
MRMNRLKGRALMSCLGICLMGLGMGTASAQDAGPALRFGTALGYPPFEYIGSDGKMTGFEIDLGNAICVALKRECQWQNVEFSGMVPALKARKFDAFIASVAVTEDRMKQVAFSDKVYSSGTRLLARKGSNLVADDAMPSGEGLAGKRIGVEQGTINEKFAKQRWAPEGVEVLSYTDQDMVFNDLMNGRLDAAIVAGVQAQIGFLSSEKGADYAFTGQSISDPMIGSSYSAIAVNKGSEQLLGDLNRAIAQLRADGTYQRIAGKYFPPTLDIYSE